MQNKSYLLNFKRHFKVDFLKYITHSLFPPCTGMQNNAKICIEPSAFEWCGWYKNGMPSWLSPAYLSSHGFRVNAEHK